LLGDFSRAQLRVGEQPPTLQVHALIDVFLCASSLARPWTAPLAHGRVLLSRGRRLRRFPASCPASARWSNASSPRRTTAKGDRCRSVLAPWCPEFRAGRRSSACLRPGCSIEFPYPPVLAIAVPLWAAGDRSRCCAQVVETGEISPSDHDWRLAHRPRGDSVAGAVLVAGIAGTVEHANDGPAAHGHAGPFLERVSTDCRLRRAAEDGGIWPSRGRPSIMFGR